MTDLNSIHAEYLRLRSELFAINSNCPYYLFERQWYEFDKAGFTVQDLALVMRWVKWSNKTHDYQYSMQLRSLLDLERFTGLLEMATGWQEQNKKPKMDSNKVEVLRATFREPESPPARPLKDVFEAMRKASE